MNSIEHHATAVNSQILLGNSLNVNILLDDKSAQMADMLYHLQTLYDARNVAGRATYTYCGFETRKDPNQYHWDGMKRGADAAHPYLVFQYTFDGLGHYASGAENYAILPGMAFNALIPSSHRYYLPLESSGWTFFWIILHHPYVVERIARRRDDTGAVFALDMGDPLFVQAIRLFTQLCQSDFSDVFAEEQALFAFMFEYERFAEHTRYEQPARDFLLAEIRSHVLQVLHRPVDSAELGALRGMSRSNFTHYFTNVTGLSPARFVRSVRLEEVAFRLLYTDQKLEVIASETGFADANHLCKAFRQHYHLSPGQYRKQIRTEPTEPVRERNPI